MRHRASASVLPFLALLALAAGVPATASALGVPPLDHVIVVVMENKSYDQTRVLPYTASLIAANSACSNFFADTHPSQPNYIAMWCGSTLGISNDVCPPAGSPWPYENLGHACEAAGKPWRSYAEALPTVGSTACTATNYVRRHCPWSYFSNLTHTNERPYSDLAADIAANTLPALAYVIPDQCDNTHNCALAVGDAWLAANLPAMITAVGPNGVVILTWDEDDGSSSNHILTVFAGATVKSGFTSTGRASHYSLLRTITDGLGLAPFAGASTATPITDVWQVTTASSGSTWGRVKTLYR